MRTASTIVFYLALLLLSSSFVEQGSWLITPQSRLLIHGSTNVNSFNCMLDSYRLSDTLEYTRDGKTIEMKITKNRMHVPIRSFDCGNKQITKDFQETLQYEKYPQLEIRFRSFRYTTLSDNATVDGIVEIAIAGNAKRYTVKYIAKVPSEDTLELTGTQAVNFSDFKLIPPKKLMGMIQVQECLEVEFNLILKRL